MLNGIIRFSVRNKLMVGLMMLVWIAYGSYEVTRLPIDAVPDITNNQVQIITTAPALGAQDVERLITFPIEQALSNIPNLVTSRSMSRFGLSLITVVFNDDADIYWARQQVTERLQQVEITDNADKPELAPVSTGLGEIYQYVVKPLPGYEDRYSLADLRTIQDWIIRRQLLGTRGVADVSAFGGELKQYEVAIVPAQLQANNLSIADVFTALQSNNQNTGGAYIEKGPTVLYIRSEGLASGMDDIRNIVVKQTSDGRPLLIRDIAKVQFGAATRYGALTYNHTGEVAGAIVMMLKGENSLEVVKNVKERIKAIQETLPEGIVIEPFLDRSKMVDNAISTVQLNLIEGALIVVFILVLFLGNLRAGFIVASVIPLSMLFAIIMMNIFGVSGNLMSLGALDFGLIVDGAVIIVEAILHRLHGTRPGASQMSGSRALTSPGPGSHALVDPLPGKPAQADSLPDSSAPVSPLPDDAVPVNPGPHNPLQEKPTSQQHQPQSSEMISQGEMNKVVTGSASQMMNAAVFGQVIILIVYLPILSLQGIEGKMFKPMAQTVSFAILGAFILSLTYVPMMSALFLSKKTGPRYTLSDRMMTRLENIYQGMLTRALRVRKTLVVAAFALFVSAVVLFVRMGGEFIPQLEEGDFAVETRLLLGTNLTTTIQTIGKISRLLQDEYPEVEKIVSRVGTAEIPTDPMPIEGGDLIIVLKNKKQWTSAKSFSELASKMSATVHEAIPGVTMSFQFPVQMRFNELMTGSKQDVVCKVFGEDLGRLAEYGEQIGAISRTVPGAVDGYVEKISGMPQIVIRYRREQIAQYGLNIAGINRAVNAAFAGAVAGKVYEGEKYFDLVVRIGQENRKSLADVQQLLLPTPRGYQIPLHLVASVEEVEGPNQIQREDARRRVLVGFNVRGRDVESVVEELKEKIARQVKLDPGYSISFAGAIENLQQAKQRLSIAVPVALLLIFVMLYFVFFSVTQSVLIYTAIPLSAIGGVFALILRGMPFSISAGVGFIALFGVTVLNGIVLISEFNRIRKNGEAPDLLSLVMQGTRNRLRPVLMTASVASLGFLPMALSNGAGAEVQRPLATVVIGGLISATLLTLFVLPALYLMIESRKTKLPKAAVVFLFPLLLAAPSLTAQQPISAEDAVATALRNNPGSRTALLQQRAAATLQRSSFNAPKTQLSTDYGQLNSIYNDTRFGISQSIEFPTVYAYQKKEMVAGYQAALAGTELTQQEIKAGVRETYYTLAWLYRKEQLLQYADSIYRLFEERAGLRYEAGEANILERTTAENSRQQIHNQLNMLSEDIGIALRNFNVWLSDTVSYTVLANQQALVPESYLQYENHPAREDGPSQENDLREVPGPSRKNGLPQTKGVPLEDELPQVKLLRSQAEAAKWRWRTEKAKLLPDLFLGYNNLSIVGTQLISGQEQFFSRSRRFHYINAGIGIPLFARSFSARAAAARAQWEALQAQTDRTRLLLQRDRQNAVAALHKFRRSLEFYEQQGLPNAEKMIHAAGEQLEAGEINYLQWVLLVHQAIGIRGEYLDVWNNYNQSVIQLQKINNQ